MSNSPYSEYEKDFFREEKNKVLNDKLEQEQEGRFSTLFGGTKGSSIFLLLRIMDYYTIFVSRHMDIYTNSEEFRKYVKAQIFDPEFIKKVLSRSSQAPDVSELKKLRNFFDAHFYRQNNTAIFYKCFYHFNQQNQIQFDEIFDYETLSSLNTTTQSIYYTGICIDDNFLNYIDSIIPSNNLLNTFQTDRAHTILRNYIGNMHLCVFFQYNHYEVCYIRYGNEYGSAYEWSIESDGVKLLETNNNMAREMDYVNIVRNGFINNNLFNKKIYCLNVHFLTPKPKSKKPNKDLIKAYLSYFTMNNPDVLDALALDFVNSVLCKNYKHKNTLVTGDYDKFHKWHSLFAIGNSPTMPQVLFYNSATSNTIENCITMEAEYVSIRINDFSDNSNYMRLTHRYFLINRDLELPNNDLKKVNLIDFPYGGEYYNLAQLSDNDKVEIIKLLIVHGWHLLNSSTNIKPQLEKDKSNLLLDNLINTDETRIPLDVLHQIYSFFVENGKSKTQLRKEIENAGFTYNTMAIRKSDKEYLKSIGKIANLSFILLEINEYEKKRSVSCKIDPKFWDEINPAIKQENELARAAEFDLYLKSLSEKYAKFYDVKLPKPEKDPLKDFVPLEKIPDDLLQ